MQLTILLVEMTNKKYGEIPSNIYTGRFVSEIWISLVHVDQKN